MAEPAPISISFVADLKEYLKAQRILYSRSVMAKVDKVVAVLLIGFGVYLVSAAGWQWWTVIWFPLAVEEWFDLFSVSQIRMKVAFRRNPMFSEECHITFSPENIHFKTATVDGTTLWTHYKRVIESEDFFLLLYGKGVSYTLIPKRCFHSEDEISAFRNLLSQTITS